jgi:glutaredoxin
MSEKLAAELSAASISSGIDSHLLSLAGRVTVFSLSTCPHCMKAKTLLTSYNVEYYEVSLTDYPEKRSDMVKLSDRLTVPQIFFNERHVGGASELEEMHVSGTLRAALDELSAMPPPSEPMLNRPDYPPHATETLKETAEPLLCVGEECIPYSDLVESLRKELPIASHTYRLRTYKNCFLGTELVDHIMSKYAIPTRAEAVQIGQSLIDSRVLDHVVREHTLKDEGLFYRLTSDFEPNVLNRYKTWDASKDEVSTDDPIKLLKHCKSLFNACIEKHTDAEGMVDYVAFAADPEYTKFHLATCEVQRLNLADMDTDLRVAFIVNLYNLSILQAFAQVGAPRTNFQRMSFFDNVKVDVGGLLYSFNDLENGVLRGNQVPPAHLSKPFSSSDPRLAAVIPRSPVEPRIHFALNCGAKSCPPIKNFTAEAVREELRINSQAFLEAGSGNLEVDVEKRVLWLTMILGWYKNDFGASDREVAETVKQWLRGDDLAKLEGLLADGRKFKIKYFTYDWSNNAKESKVYGQ